MAPSDRPQHHRRSIRWHGYDYAAAGAYFCTLCVQHRAPLLGIVQDATFIPNAAGRMVARLWQNLPERWAGLILDAYVIMPNHLHALLWQQTDEGPVAPDAANYATGIGAAPGGDRPLRTASASLGRIMQSFKAATTRAYGAGVRDGGWPRYSRHLWQRGYHDRVVRNLAELGAIREYIRLNPANWSADPEHVG